MLSETEHCKNNGFTYRGLWNPCLFKHFIFENSKNTRVSSKLSGQRWWNLCVFKHLMFENIGNARVSTKLSGQLWWNLRAFKHFISENIGNARVSSKLSGQLWWNPSVFKHLMLENIENAKVSLKLSGQLWWNPRVFYIPVNRTLKTQGFRKVVRTTLMNPLCFYYSVRISNLGFKVRVLGLGVRLIPVYWLANWFKVRGSRFRLLAG